MKTLKLWAERALKLIVLVLYIPLGLLTLLVALGHSVRLVLQRKHSPTELNNAVLNGPLKQLFKLDRAVCRWVFADFVK